MDSPAARQQYASAPLVTFTLYDHGTAEALPAGRPSTPTSGEAPLVVGAADTTAAVDRQHADILAEVNRAPLLADCQSLDVAAREFADMHPVFCAKLLDLHAQGMRQLRRVRGDGNCFYRCCLFGLLESLLRVPTLAARRVAVDRVRAVFARAKDVMLRVGYQECVLEDPLTVLHELLDTVQGGTLTPSGLEARFRDEVNNGVMYVMFLLRLCASSEIVHREEHYYPFILGMCADGDAIPASARVYCQNNVEPVASEADHVSVTALCASLGLVVRVAYVDGAPAAAGDGSQPLVVWHEFDGPSLCEQPGEPTNSAPIHLLYRPGHYDLLY